MRKGQGSLEYLIIVAVVLALIAIVVLFLTGILGGSKASGDLNKCRTAASQCLSEIIGGPSSCAYCEDACISADGLDIQGCEEGCGTACQLCKAGKTNMIQMEVCETAPPEPPEEAYCGDGMCNGDETADTCPQDCPAPVCGNGILEGDEECDDGAGNSDAPNAACRTDCTRGKCGDGILDFGEICESDSDCPETLSPISCVDCDCYSPCFEHADFGSCTGPEKEYECQWCDELSPFGAGSCTYEGGMCLQG